MVEFISSDAAATILKFVDDSFKKKQDVLFVRRISCYQIAQYKSQMVSGRMVYKTVYCLLIEITEKTIIELTGSFFKEGGQ